MTGILIINRTASDMLLQANAALLPRGEDRADKASSAHPDCGPINLSQLLWRGGSPRLHCNSRRARQVSLAKVPSSFLIEVSARVNTIPRTQAFNLTTTLSHPLDSTVEVYHVCCSNGFRASDDIEHKTLHG